MPWKNKIFDKSLFVYLFLFLQILPVFGRAQEDDEPLVTISFVEKDLRQALREISEQTEVNIVPDNTVQGKVSIELKAVPLEEALRMILSIGNYAFRKMPEGYYLVGLCMPDSPSFSQLSVTEYLQPNYLRAKEIENLLSELYRPYLKINENTNSVTITASPEIIRRFKEDLAKIDQPAPQGGVNKREPTKEREAIDKYYAQISSIIEAHKRFPDIKDLRKDEPREVVLAFTLFSDGTIGGVEVLKSSGSSTLDSLASKSIEEAAPFPPFPAEMTQPSITFMLPIRYEP